MIIYWMLAALFLLVGYFTDVERSILSRRRYLCFCFFLLFLLMGLRGPSVGNDTMQYYQAYETLGKLPWRDVAQQRYEWGFFAFCKILYGISPHPQTLLLVTSGFFCAVMAHFLLRYGENIVLAAVLFLLLNFIAVFLNLMRQMMAVCMVILAMERWWDKKYLSSVLLLLAAPMFHRSALICLLFPFLSKRRFPAWLWIVFFGTAGVCFWQYQRLYTIAAMLLGRYSHYLGSEFGNSNYFGMLLQALVCLSVLLYGIYKRRCGTQKEALPVDFQMYMLAFGTFCYIVGMRMYMFSRMTPYFTIYYLTWLGKCEPLRRWKTLLFPNQSQTVRLKHYSCEPLAVIAVAAVYFLIIHLFRPEWQGIVPYCFFWQMQE